MPKTNTGKKNLVQFLYHSYFAFSNQGAPELAYQQLFFTAILFFQFCCSGGAVAGISDVKKATTPV